MQTETTKYGETMGTGTGLFAVGAAIAIVALIVATRSKWNWRKFAVPSLAIFVGVFAIGGASIWAWDWYSNRPTKQSELWDVKIGDTVKDVRFKRGIPAKEDVPESGLSYDYVADEMNATVRFKNEKVRGVILHGANVNSVHFLQGIGIGGHSKEITERFGSDVVITSSRSGLKRLYAYPQYQIFFGLGTDKVEIFGIYDPTYPVPIKFAEDEEK
ncbi:hypothetical protein B9Z51_11670 [Limnohabitans sp. T6-5]|nr:hypothetical protein B9Z51_11670 [Limnohabitans sp. T6-5]